jgi:hypothetical protein
MKKRKDLPVSEKKTIEQWAAERNTEDWLFAATKAVTRWAEGREVTAKEYDDAVHKAANAGGGDGNPFDVKAEAPKNEEKHLETFEGGSHQ